MPASMFLLVYFALLFTIACYPTESVTFVAVCVALKLLRP